MQKTRRKFVKAVGCGTVLTIGAPVVSLANGRSPGRAFSAFSVSARDLEPYIGKSFDISCNCGSSMAVLKDVKELKSQGARPRALPRRRGFVAVFDGVDSAAFDQQISVVEHAELGRLELMLGATDGRRLEAVFN